MSLLNLKVSNHEDRLLRDQMERRDRHIAGMETKIALQNVAIDRVEAEKQALTTQVAALEEHIANLQATYTDEFANQKTYINRLEDDLKSKDEHILYLEKLLQGIELGASSALPALSRASSDDTSCEPSARLHAHRFLPHEPA